MEEQLFPVITVSRNCFVRVVNGLEEMYVSFARFDNGTHHFAGESVHSDHHAMEETVIKVIFLRPEFACGPFSSLFYSSSDFFPSTGVTGNTCFFKGSLESGAHKKTGPARTGGWR